MAHVNLSTRCVCISDTHSSYEFSLPEGEILIHAGDISRTGKPEELEYFLQWLTTLKQYRLKIIIAGNHDVTMDEEYYEKTWNRFHREKYDSQQIQKMFRDPTLFTDYGIVYLQDETFVDPVTQLKFYGRLVSIDRLFFPITRRRLVLGNPNSVIGHLMSNVTVQ